MADSLKLVCLGGTPEEVVSLMGAYSSAFGDAELERGVVAGSEVLSFKSSLEVGESQQRFTLYALAGQPDFRSVYQLLLSNADGVLGWVPADLNRCGESSKVLIHILKAVQLKKDEERELPFLLQYNWSDSTNGPSPEELDQALGVNPQVVTRVFTSADTPEPKMVMTTLLEQCKAPTEAASTLNASDEALASRELKLVAQVVFSGLRDRSRFFERSLPRMTRPSTKR